MDLAIDLINLRRSLLITTRVSPTTNHEKKSFELPCLSIQHWTRPTLFESSALF